MKVRAELRTLAVLGVAIAGIGSRAEAGIVTVPSGLNSGDHYRLMFVTSTTTAATSSSIAYYNQFVADAANSVQGLAALGITWTAIASTDTTDAIANIGADSGVPIYGLDGWIIASDATTAGPNTLFATTTNLFSVLFNDPIITEQGTFYGSRVWTGTNPQGLRDSFLTLGHVGGLYPPRAGYAAAPGNNSADVFQDDFGQPASALLPLYAISSELTYEAAPEPTSIALAALGLALLLFAQRASKRRNLVG
jgi:hypothetical protein